MSTAPLFSIVDKEVVITNLTDGRVMWSGRPLGRDAVELLQLDDTEFAVVLLEAFGSPPDDRSNLVAIDSKGEVRWRAALPTSSPTDCFTSVEVVDGAVSAFSWSSHRVLIDADCGCTLRDKFTK